MIGAIIGDIVGSIYEWCNIKTKEFPLFGKNCGFTDDSVITIAVAEGLMNGGTPYDYIKAMKRLGRIYINVGYGGHFRRWLLADDCSHTTVGETVRQCVFRLSVGSLILSK